MYPENSPYKLRKNNIIGYLSFVAATIICRSLFKDRKAELSLFGNTFLSVFNIHRNQSIDLHCKWGGRFLCNVEFKRYTSWSAGIFHGFGLSRFWLGAPFLQISRRITRQSIETCIWREFSHRGGWVEFLFFVQSNFWAEYSTFFLCCLWTTSWPFIFNLSWH